MNTDRTPRWAAAGIFLLAGSIILYQIALTRLCAIMMWHHFTYLVVSIALLGFGAAGSILTARRDSLRSASPARSLVITSALYGLAVMLSFGFATQVRIDTLRITEDPGNVTALLLLLLIFTGPMLLAGLAIGQALTRLARHVNRLYFADLLGSAAGAALSVVVLSRVDSAAAVMIAGAAGAAGGLAFSFGALRRHVILASACLLASIGVVCMFLGGLPALGLPSVEWPVPFAPTKEFAFHAERGLTDRRLPSATAEVEVSRSHPAGGAMGGDFGVLDRVEVEGRFVAQDGTAPTMLYRNAADLEAFPFLDDSQAGSAYVALEAAGRKEPKVLVIGMGGGIDVMIALAHGSPDVTAVDINAAMVSMVQEHYADYLGGLFNPGRSPLADRIRVINREGRSYLRHSDERFDVIQMSGVDSFTALSTGAYTLAESYLYTKEAVKEFYEHLEDGGCVNYSRFILTYPKQPRETLRLANIARHALQELGLEDPAGHIAVFRGINWASTMIRKGPFTPEEIVALEAFAAREGFHGLVFNPLWSRDQDIALEPQPEVMAREYARLECGPMVRPLLISQESEGAVFEGFAAAYRLAFQDDAAGSRAELERIAGLFRATERATVRQALEGMLARYLQQGRVQAERLLATRRDFHTLLRGTPEEREAFVAAYPYDVTPCSDDDPFFFNYYRYAQLLGSEEARPASAEDIVSRRYHPDFPVGHAVLLASLVMILVMAVLLILAPLRSLGRHGVATPGRWRYLAYFASLGLGFMFIEIVLMQKLVIFLGHPTYALSVVLAALLGFAGLGSLLAGRLQDLGRRSLMLLMLGVVTAIVLEALLLEFLLPLLLGWPFGARVAVAVAAILPLGLALGMPFPTGIRIVERNCPQLLPWGWAVNGFTSVLGSILCILLSQATGFSRVFLIAAGIYLLGFLFMQPARAVDDSGDPTTA